MKRFLGILVASMFLASAAFAADSTKGEEKKAEGKAKAEEKKAEKSEKPSK